MLIRDEDILKFIQSHYDGYSNYVFKQNSISEEKDFIVIKDIHDINDNVIDISKDVFVRGLEFSRQTNSINIINICDSLNAESCDLGEEIYKQLEKYNSIYTKAFLRNGSRWVDLYAFNLCCDKAKEITGNNNPRSLFKISKYTYLLNKTAYNLANLRFSLVTLRSCLELMSLEIRKMNYDMFMRPVTTVVNGNESETMIQTKYMNNFFLHEDIKFDHEFHVFGTIAGLVARKNRGQFGRIKAYYYQFELLTLLNRDYSYLNLDIKIGNSIDKPLVINKKQIAHKVLLRRKKIIGNFSASSKFTAKLLSKYTLPKETYIYDYDNPIELSSLSISEIKILIESREGMIVYQIDETLYDSYSIYDTINSQANIVVEKGEFFDAHHNLLGVTYKQKGQLQGIGNYTDYISIFSKTLQNDQIQRIKLFDSMMEQYKNATIRTEQAEKAVAELHLLNEQINELNTHLQEKVAERTHELELSNQQRINTFINLTHETKTPLTLINNYLEEYISKNGESEELRIIKSSTEKLSKDIVNFFDMERFNRGMDIFNHNQIANFSAILNHSIALFNPYASKKRMVIKATIQEDIHIKADPSAIFRIINNLIENAIKYADSNNEIQIVLKTLKGKVKFIVQDNGLGIPIELRDKVFEPYYQIHREKRNYQGMGMGLSIVKHIIHSLNGEIKISDNPQSIGTQISILLATHKISDFENISTLSDSDRNLSFAVEQLQLNTKSYDEDKASILIVEDNIPLLNYMVNKLSYYYNVYAAVDGIHALEQLKIVKSLDLIISDIMMDRMDGLELCKSIAENKKFNHIPFIFITAKTAPEDELQGFTMGAIDYIQKPFLIDALIYKINAILGNLEKQRLAIVNRAFKSLVSNDHTEIEKNSFKDNCVKFNLTPREIDIVKLITQGCTYKQIAEKCFIAQNTVSRHTQNIFEKVAVSNKVELLNKLQNESVDT